MRNLHTHTSSQARKHIIHPAPESHEHMCTTSFTSSKQGCKHVSWAQSMSALGRNPRCPEACLQMRKPSLPFSFQARVMRYRPS